MKARLLFGLIMSSMMAFTMSFIMTFIHVGWVDNFLLIWLRGFAIGLIVAFPTSLVAVPLAKKIISKLNEENNGIR